MGPGLIRSWRSYVAATQGISPTLGRAGEDVSPPATRRVCGPFSPAAVVAESSRALPNRRSCPRIVVVRRDDQFGEAPPPLGCQSGQRRRCPPGAPGYARTPDASTGSSRHWAPSSGGSRPFQVEVTTGDAQLAGRSGRPDTHRGCVRGPVRRSHHPDRLRMSGCRRQGPSPLHVPQVAVRVPGPAGRP